jgi:hypothetical protein
MLLHFCKNKMFAITFNQFLEQKEKVGLLGDEVSNKLGKIRF